MGLRKGISYQWKLFFPLVIGMWLALLTMGVWTFYTTRQSNIDRIQEQLDLINSRVIDYYEGPLPNSGLRAYLTFIYNYYRENPTFDAIRITVYMDGQMELSYGDPIILTPEEAAQTGGVTTESYGHNTNAFFSNSRDREYFYRIKRSADHRFAVYTFLPMDNQLEKSLDPGIRLFVALFVLAVFLTLMAYLASRHFTRNIKLLRSVANQAVKADGFLPPEDFPHDELGDINRQIVTLFNARTQAMERQRREHAVALHAIEEKAKAKRQMSSNINHELRTPIGVIKGYLDTILENPDMDFDTRNHFIRKALEHANRLVSLISDVSAITRLEDGAEMISTEELDFHDIAFTLANDIEESGVLGNMEFRYDVPLDCKVKGNYNLLNGMLMNLARNAAAYSKGTVCELLYIGQDATSYEFVFRDDGKGVSEEHIPHLFERFYRVDSGRARKSGGTGLGLPIVQSTILAHGGTISVANRPTGGLAFTFTLQKG